MKQKLFITFILFVLLFIICSLWWNQGIKPADPTNSTPVVIIVKTGESTREISEKLQKAGIIRSPLAYFLLARFGGYAERIQAGDFRLSPSMNLYDVAQTLTHGTSDTRVTIKEGIRNAEIALILTKELSIPESAFGKSASEGYMFPDTYLFPKDATVKQVIEIIRTNFDKKVDLDIRQKAQSKNISVEKLITIASLVEREAKSEEDRPIVASVILNRLNIDMKLDIDATVQYALGYQQKEKTWWKKDLTIDDLAVESPYNTYKNPGLPPGPICNPGLAVIQAVINAPQTDYLYYISDKNGKIHPAATIEEHNANIAKYLNQ